MEEEKCVYHNIELNNEQDCDLCNAEVKENKSGVTCSCNDVDVNECKC